MDRIAEEELYCWYKRKRDELPAKYREDFGTFRDWAESRGWEPGCAIRKCGAVWQVIRLADSGYVPVPGYSHRPCLECRVQQEETCTFTKKCEKYKQHWDASMAACRRRLRAKK